MCGWPPLWLYGISKLTDGPRPRSQRLRQAQNVVGAGFRHAASDLLWASKTDGCIAPPSIPHPCPSLSFPTPKSSLALAWFRLAPCLVLWDLGVVLWDFKTDGWPPVPISLELALAMLRLAPWLVLWGFKTDGWPPVPIPKASPGPKCRWSWLSPCCGCPLSGFMGFQN